MCTPSQRRRPQVLVVDDDENIALLITLTLRMVGLDVIAAHNGTVALEVLARRGIDALLLDLQLPDLSGFAVLAQSTRDRTAVPTVFITANDEPERRRAATDLGAAGFLTKPFDLTELVTTVQRLLPHEPANPPQPRPASEEAQLATAD